MDDYADYLGDVSMVENSMKSMDDAGSILKMLFLAVKSSSRKIYLIVDEYDHFANDIIAIGDGEFYKDIIRSSGFVREIMIRERFLYSEHKAQKQRKNNLN